MKDLSENYGLSSYSSAISFLHLIQTSKDVIRHIQLLFLVVTKSMKIEIMTGVGEGGGRKVYLWEEVFKTTYG